MLRWPPFCCPSVGVLMPVTAFDHFNIRTPRSLMESVKCFYCDVIGLKEGYRPNVSVEGYWLYLGDLPVLHLMEWQDPPSDDFVLRGYLDHVAFSCEGLAQMKNTLDDFGVAYRRRDFPVQGNAFTQLILEDPVGNGVELNFMGESEL